MYMIKRPDLRWKVRERLAQEGGFSLAELIVFIVVLSIFLVGLFAVMEGAFRGNAVSYNLSKVEDAAREAMSAMIRQIRVATHIYPDLSTNGVLRFRGDINGDGTQDEVGFKESDSGGYLQRMENGDWVDWVESVDSITFTYFGYDDDIQMVEISPGSPDWNLRVKRIEIVINCSASTLHMNITRTFQGEVALRNNLE